MTDDQPSLAVGAIKLDSCGPVRCQTVWVGTGEDSIRRDTQYGRGVLRGKWDGSKYVWKLLGESHFALGSISALVLDWSSPDTSAKNLYVALSSGQTSNATQSTVTTTPPGLYGIWKSTDAGETWINVLPQNTPATDLEIDPLDPRVLFAGIRNVGLFRSTDAGAHWQAINNGIPASVVTTADWPEIALRHAPGDPGATLYAVLGTCPHPQERSGGSANCSPGVFKSINSGDSWVQVRAPGPSGLEYGEPLTTYTSYAHTLAIHPFDSNILWFGGINLYKSTNGGVSWIKVGNNSLHPDHHGIFVRSSGEFPTGILGYDVNDGGFFVGDGQDTWLGNLQEGLEITQFQSVSSSGLVNHVIGGTQDNGTNVFLGSSVWEHVDDGDSASTIIDLDTGVNLYDVYVGTEPRRCMRSDFCKYLWPDITNGITNTNNVSWYPPLIQDPNAVGGQHPLLFASNQLYRSSNDGSSWTAITPSSPLGGVGTIPELAGVQNPISAVAIAPSDSSRIYVGYYDGQLFTTANGKDAVPTWTRVDNNGLPDRPITSIAVHPTDPRRVFVSFTGFGEHSVYTTTQAGATWAAADSDTSVANTFAKNPVNVLKIEVASPHRMWAGTDDGAYSRDNPELGSNWARTSVGLPRVAVYGFDISANGKKIYAATHGRGVWTMTTDPTPDVYIAECCGPVDLFDPQPFVSIYVAALEPKQQQCTLQLREKDRVCSRSEVDANGARLGTNSRGFLVASKAGEYSERPLTWACYEGKCAGGITFASCNVTDVEVSCGQQTVRSAVKRPTESLDPPSTQLGFVPDLHTLGGVNSYVLSAMVKMTGGRSRVLCSQGVSFSAKEPQISVLKSVVAALNENSRCREAGVSAQVLGSLRAGKSEDEGPTPLRIALRAPRLKAIQLITAVESKGVGSVTVDNFGIPLRGTLVVPQLLLNGTARGGALEIVERTSLGTCVRTLQTHPGEGAEGIAAQVQRAFLTSQGQYEKAGSLALENACPSRQAARDASRYGAVLRFPLGQEVTIRNTDPGIGFRLSTDR